jgi:hypothetical protein
MGIDEMAEVRCPMCSKSNPENAENCVQCGARLKPLIVDSPPPEEPIESHEPTPDEGYEEEAQDWLDRIRAEADEDLPPDEIPEEDVFPEEEIVERSELVDEEPEIEEPSPGEESPDWLGRLREVDLSRDEGPPEGEVPEWLSAFADEFDEVVEPEEVEPDYLDRIREKGELEAEAPEGEAEPVEEDWLAKLREEDEQISEDIWEEVAEAETELEIPEIDDQPSLEEILEEPALEVEKAEPVEDELEAARADFEEEAPPKMPWDEEVPLELPEVPPEAIDLPEPEIPEAEDLPEFEGKLVDVPPEPEEVVEPVREVLPQVPALIFDGEDEEAILDAADLDLDDIELPEWLAELREREPSEAEPAEAAPTDLAPATLPSWLEAMRPVETFRSVVDIETVDEQKIESAGPLAGLKGVLMAEPVVAMPRSASASASRLEVTERQYAQAELLHRMIEEEGRELPDVAAKRIRTPVLRWIVTAVMLVAVILPNLMSIEYGRGFPFPLRVPRDLEPLISLVDTVGLENPALIVFDYTPGYYGELNAVASPLLRHILTRGLRVATVSTQPTGPALAEGLMSQLSEETENYVHLGYLSGGPTAVQLFSASPRNAILRGFRHMEDPSSPTGWASPIMEGVERLSDFGLIVVITAGTDNARTWAEQAYPWKGDTPLLMVLSTGAEPLVRPYFEALEPQVDGILASMPSAVAYERYLGFSGSAQTRWNAFGAGVLSVEIILFAGLIYGIVNWFLRPQPVEAGGNEHD